MDRGELKRDAPSVVRFEGTSLTLAPSAKLRITETSASCRRPARAR
jgi:hypothetical protein